MSEQSPPGAQPRLRIFLSSTKLDLEAERTAAWLALRPDHDVVRMEDFTSATHDDWEECVKQLSSCDAYVLLIGHQYGSELADTGRSYTHAEYHRARELGLPILAFVKAGFESAWERAHEALRLRDFHDEVVNSHHVMHPHFRSSEELAHNLWDTLRTAEIPKPSRPTFFARPRSVADSWQYAIGQVRRERLVAYPFRAFLVDTQIALADRLPDESHSLLLEKALDVRREMGALGATPRLFNEIEKWTTTDDQRFAERLAEVATSADAVLCFVHGRFDYPRTQGFARAVENVGICYPAHVDPGERYDAVYIEYKMRDISPCTVASRSVEYLSSLLDQHVRNAYSSV